MKLLNLVIDEYITIVEYLLETEEVNGNRIIIDRDIFKGLLEKYPYLKFNQKTKIYKQLNFIIHEKNNYTMPCKDKTTGKVKRKVVINYETYNTIKYLQETNAT